VLGINQIAYHDAIAIIYYNILVSL